MKGLTAWEKNNKKKNFEKILETFRVIVNYVTRWDRALGNTSFGQAAKAQFLLHML